MIQKISLLFLGMFLMPIAHGMTQAPSAPRSKTLTEQITAISTTAIAALALYYTARPLAKQISNKIDTYLHPKAKVGVVSISGILTDGYAYCEQIRTFFEDPTISAIVLKVSSPGGVPGPAHMVYQEIKALKQINPKVVITLSESLIGSGAYYIALASDYIVCTPGTIVGSIGALMPHLSLVEFINKHGISYEIFRGGEYKVAGDPLLPMTENQKKHMQTLVDNIYVRFVETVAAERHLTTDPKLWAEGKIFTGEQALNLGLIDKLGSINTVIELLKEKAHLTQPIEWIHPVTSSSFFAHILGNSEQQQAHINSFAKNVVFAFSNAITEMSAKQSIIQ